MRNDTPGQCDSVGADDLQSMSDTRAREALILGQPPRIAPLKPSELDKEASETALALRKAASGSTSDEVTEFTATMLRHPALYRCHVALGIQLYRGALAPRDRELAVLRIGWLCKAPYEWGEHVKIGKRVGVTAEEIERVIIGSTASGWNEDDRAIIRAVEELIDEAMISNETWAILSRRLDEKQLIELPLLVGNYVALAYFQNSLRLRLISGNPGLSAR
jgi:4-carboxymuconolactone decarboxylase